MVKSLNTDDFIEMLRRDELEDASKLTPIEYARLRGMKPQLVYYYIRNGALKVERCQCGRKVVDVRDTDGFFANKQSGRSSLQPTLPPEEEMAGSDVDTEE